MAEGRGWAGKGSKDGRETPGLRGFSVILLRPFGGLGSGCSCGTVGSGFLLAVLRRPLIVPSHRALLAWPLPSSGVSTARLLAG